MLHELPDRSLNDSVDRKALATHLMEVARHLKPGVAQPSGVPFSDVRLEELRQLLLGREIEILHRLTEEVENPDLLATSVGRVLPSAIEHAYSDPRLGQVLVPTLEKAAENSIRSDPRALVNVLYPLILPALRRSIGESIDETIQSLNETLKHSLSLRGLRWRWEAWRTGIPFAEVVLKHTLVYQVEHAFLIHRKTGLLISHVAAENAASQDPQLVSSMLSAIQDFVHDSFTGEDQQGLDSLQLGELRLWSEPGPLATLVAVIRGTPPEGLRDTLGSSLARIHADRARELELFNGDSSGFEDVEKALQELVKIGQQKPRSRGNGLRMAFRIFCLILVAGAGVWAFNWLNEERRWQGYLENLRAQPGIVITEASRRGEFFIVAGMRDPLAVDPDALIKDSGIPAERVIASWAPYEALDSDFVLRRMRKSLSPPESVSLLLQDGRIIAQGAAPSDWLLRARDAERVMPAGAPQLDISKVENMDAGDQAKWDAFISRLRTEPGIVITQAVHQNGVYSIAGLRDPLSFDPKVAMLEAGLDPERISANWAPYQSLDPPFVIRRLELSLEPPPSVTLTVENGQIVGRGSATKAWLDRARLAARLLPAGAPGLDVSQIVNSDAEKTARLRQAIDKVRLSLQSRSIGFDYKVALPSEGQEAILDAIARDLNEIASLSTPEVRAKVTLTGHSDSAGEGTYNLALSVARSEAVRALLRKRGVDPDLLSVRGAGPLEPIDTGTTKEAYAANRRVSFTVGIEEPK
jgi:outer membrane protein OmpA-like peptidoglycan-associated protein